MPILGILASSRPAVAADTGAMFPLQVVTVGPAGAADVTFTNIPATYTHLQVRFISKSAYTTGVSDSLYAYFNSDTGSNYSYHFLRGNGTAASASGDVSTAFMWLGNQANSGTGMTSIFGVGVCDVLDYANTNKYKTIRSLQGFDSNGDGFALLSSSAWRSTSAVTSMKFSFANGNIASGSQFALYGVKGAA